MQITANAVRAVVDFALPPRCPACGVITPEQDRFCAECWQKLHFLSEPACVTCDLPLPFLNEPQAQCAACLANAPRHKGIKAAVAYGEVSREIALKLKHGGKIGLARLVANSLRRHLHAIPPDALLVPVPLHWSRLWKRRYNQAALIAGELGKLLAIPHCPDALVRTRRTRSLGGLSARARTEMVRNVFAINPRHAEKVKGRAVVLVDDVYTSGATTDACVNMLMRGGATGVQIFCWARVLPDALEIGSAD